jgi:hypothetical protein
MSNTFYSITINLLDNKLNGTIKFPFVGAFSVDNKTNKITGFFINFIINHNDIFI